MAGLIPQSFINDLLARTDIVDIIGERISLKKTGRNHQALCPFHKEKSPSFTASQDKQFYYCFGCGASGNAVGFIMDFDHVDFPEAVEILARHAGMEVPRERSSHRQKRQQYDTLYHCLGLATKWYAQQLNNCDIEHKASNYLKKRGLKPSTITHFQIGYAPPGWDNLLKQHGDTIEKQRQLLDVGLIVENTERKSTYDRFRDRIIFPIRDLRGRVVGFGGRVLGDEKPKYLNSPETTIFQKGRELYGLYEARQANRELQQILVVEGYMDVIALAQQGIDNAVATLGTATTVDHLNTLFKHTSQVTFCFDGDNAGRQAAWRALENALPAMNDGRQIRFLFLPQGEDPDSLVRTEGPEAFLKRLQDKTQALTFDDYLFQHFDQEIDSTTLDGKARLVHKVTPFIHRLPEGSFKRLMIMKLGEISALGTSTVSSIIQSNIDNGTGHTNGQPSASHPPYRPTGEDSADQRQQPNTATPLTRTSANSEKRTLRSYRRFDDFPGGQSAPTILLRPQQRALRLLLERPDLANQVDLKALNPAHGDEDVRFLITLVESLRRNPVASCYGVLGSWYGTRLGERLKALMKTAIPLDNAEQTLYQNLKNLTTDTQKPSSQLSDMERLRLVSSGKKIGWLERKQTAQQEKPIKH